MYWCHSRTLCIIRDLPRTKLLAALAAFAVTLGTAKVYSDAAAKEPSKVGALNGRVGSTRSGGEVLPPESATVYILFSSAMERDSLGRNVFLYPIGVDMAGRQFTYQLNNLLEKNKDLKRVEKSVRHTHSPEDANQIAACYLQGVDQALTRVRSWLAKHPDRSWQMKTIAPDVQGFWSAEGLQPGGYEVVVRGTLPGYDADWEGPVYLPPGGTVSLPLTRPRFFRHE
jgi:hypothetical protein